MESQFEVTARSAAGRMGKMTVRGRTMVTPNIFMVVDPRLSNPIPCQDLVRVFGVQAVFTNAYIAYKDPSLRERILTAGSIHTHLGFDGIIATDSGAFQQYMYGGKLDVSPAEIESFEEKIGADCPVILDTPVQPDDSWEIASQKVSETIARAKDNLKRRTATDRAWFGPVHGSRYLDLIMHSATEMSKLDFGIYAVGGVVKIFNDYRFDLGVEAILTARRHIRPDRPLHVFGLGLPQFFALAAACGADTFDSAAYALFAKEGRYFSLSGTLHLSEMQEFPCCCPACASANPSQVRNLPLLEQTTFLARHNLYCTMAELRTIREAIREGTLWELVEMRARAHPRLLDALRVAGGTKYRDYFDLVEPRINGRGLSFTGPETLNRANIRRVARFLEEEYLPPAGRDLGIVLPEVDTSPRVSPASRTWVTEIEKNANVFASRLHFLHASSAFGVVPEEILDAYPFSQLMVPFRPDLVQEYQFTTMFTKFLKRLASHYQCLGIYRPTEFISEHRDNITIDSSIIDALNEQTLGQILPIHICSNIEELVVWVRDHAVHDNEGGLK